MLTADLAMSWQRGRKTGPRLIDTEDPQHLREAGELIDVFRAHEGRRRRELEEALEEYVGVGTDYRILRGLIKLLTDRCRFEVGVAVDPVEVRRVLFAAARQHHPLIDDEAARGAVFAQAAKELGCAPGQVAEGLYADLPENQKLIEFEELNARELLDLYNVAQAQALLYRCVEMYLWVEPQNPEGFRELFNAIKAYRLIHTVKGSPEVGYEIRLDGPVSMFHRSQKYGVQMAVFLPALLLCTGWRMRAEVAGKRGDAGRGASAFFELDAERHGLRSHYLNATPYENPILEKLVESWERFDSPWRLERGREVIDFGEGALIPDFVIHHPDGARFYLEVLGFWTPKHLHRRLEELTRGGLKNFLIAAWDELRGSREPLPKIPPHTIIFKRNLDPVVVEMAINQLLSDS
ncbi:MAG: DUF790 family protein [Pyrinomonadaceae bacterium]|nr:DUF790 family protein [Pyrinomonadaceae bacterium]